ncbi:hypothetical protein ABXK87_01065, partial [Yersinia enterocolitica]
RWSSGTSSSRVMVSKWYCCGEASLSMAVSPFFALTLLDQSLSHMIFVIKNIDAKKKEKS